MHTTLSLYLRSKFDWFRSIPLQNTRTKFKNVERRCSMGFWKTFWNRFFTILTVTAADCTALRLKRKWNRQPRRPRFIRVQDTKDFNAFRWHPNGNSEVRSTSSGPPTTWYLLLLGRFQWGLCAVMGWSLGAGQLVVYATRGKRATATRQHTVGYVLHQFINHLLRTIIEAFIEPLSIDHDYQHWINQHLIVFN